MHLADVPGSQVAVDYDDAPSEELEDAFGQLTAFGCAVQAARVEMVRSLMSRSEEWSADAPTFPHWLSFRYGMSLHDARELASVADASLALPRCFAAFRAGELCWERLVLLCRFVDSESDADYAQLAPFAPLGQLRRLAREHRGLVEDDVLETPSSLTFRESHSGTRLFLRGSFEMVAGLELKKALEIRADAIGPNLHGIYPESCVRLAEGLMQMVSEVASAPPGIEVDPDRATLVVETTLEDLACGGGGDLDGRVRICAATLARLGCDARIQTVHVDDEGHITGVGRVTRTIPPWLSRRLKKPDQGCRFPGCGHTSWTHGHHIKEWVADEGPTDLSNLITLCGRHHTFLHEGHWHIEGDPSGQVEFVRPDGRRYTGAPPPLRDDVLHLFPAFRSA